VDIENVVFAQIPSMASPSDDGVLLAASQTTSMHVRNWIVELLRFLLSGGSSTDPDLVRRCHRRAVMDYGFSQESSDSENRGAGSRAKGDSPNDPDRPSN